MAFKIAIINDEISSNLPEIIDFLKSYSLNYVELRTLNQKNMLDHTQNELEEIYKTLKQNGISVSALASPLFKWKIKKSKELTTRNQENFFFDSNLDRKNKISYIRKACQVAKALRTDYVRIFSTLKSIADPNYDFLQDPLLKFAIEETSKYNLTLLLENEPICYISSKQDLQKIIKNKIPNLKLWLDIANIYEIGEQITLDDICNFKEDIYYIHLKNFDKIHQYVPLDQGLIDYKQIIRDMTKVMGNKDVILSIETHIKSHTAQATSQSIQNLKKYL